jgi:hypothetical protein
MRSLKGSLTTLEVATWRATHEVEGVLWCGLGWWCINDRRSATGYAFSLGDGVVSWSVARGSPRWPRLQQRRNTWRPAIAQEKPYGWDNSWMMWGASMMRAPWLIMCDIQGAIALAKDPMYHARTKHIEVQHYFVHEKVARGAIILQIHKM